MLVTSIGDALFTKTQQRVLALLYGKPDQSFYTNEIVRWADMGRGTIRRELERLVSAGLLLVIQQGNQIHYQANQKNPIFQELSAIVKKTFGIANVIKEALQSEDNQIELAFIYGSVAKGVETASSDIDLLVVSNFLAYADLMTILIDAEQTLGRPVNPSIYTLEQIKNKLKQNNSFLTKVMEHPKIWIKGGESDIR